MTAEAVYKHLVSLGKDGDLHSLDEPGETAAAAAGQLGCTVAAIANSIVLDVDGEPVLVLVSGARKIHFRSVGRLVGGKKVRQADPAEVKRATGQEVGGVSPVGHPAKLRTVIDENLFELPEIWVGAGDEWTLFRTSAAELEKITEALTGEISRPKQ